MPKFGTTLFRYLLFCFTLYGSWSYMARRRSALGLGLHTILNLICFCGTWPADLSPNTLAREVGGKNRPRIVRSSLHPVIVYAQQAAYYLLTFSEMLRKRLRTSYTECAGISCRLFPTASEKTRVVMFKYPPPLPGWVGFTELMISHRIVRPE